MSHHSILHHILHEVIADNVWVGIDLGEYEQNRYRTVPQAHDRVLLPGSRVLLQYCSSVRAVCSCQFDFSA